MKKGNRNPKDDRTLEIAKILDININAIKKHDYKESIDLLYTLMWLEELIPKYQIDISKVPNINDENIVMFKQFINEWNVMREKRNKREITYEEYIEWKLTYEVKSYD